MIFTLATYQVAPHKHEDFANRCEEEMWPKMEERGAKVIGLWIVMIGGPERIIQMTRYESLSHWQETRAWDSRGDGTADSMYANLPETVLGMDLIALSPITRHQPDGETQEAEPGIYAMRRFIVERENVRRLAELSEDGWWPWVRAGQGLKPVGQWRSLVSQDNLQRLYMITRYRDVAHWEATRIRDPEPADPQMRALWKKGIESINER